MATLSTISRSSVPFAEFDDGDQLQKNVEAQVVAVSAVAGPATSDFNAARLFMTALVDHLCSLYEKNPNRRERLFQMVCKTLVSTRIISPNWNASEFASMRHMYQKSFVCLMEAALQSVEKDMTITVNAGISSSSIHALLPARMSTAPSLALDRMRFIPSKLACEFRDVIKIGKGAYGQVYRALKMSENVAYAVKEIVLKDMKQDYVNRTYSEVRLLAALSHPNIIRYYDSWMELRLFSQYCDCADEPENDLLSESLPKHDAVSQTHDSEYSNGERDDSKSEVLSTAADSRDDSIVFADDVDLPNPSAASKLAVARQYSRSHSCRMRYQPYNQLQRHHSVLYIQMELCGMTLKDWIDRRNFSPSAYVNDEENRRILKQILKGVEYIHLKQLIHRDLKPQNIFLQTDVKGSKIAKIGDFGLATLLAVQRMHTTDLLDSPPDISKNGARVDLTAGIGTTLYSSPEQLEKSHYDSKSDMYSIGIILYELYRIFGTESERRVCLSKLRESGIELDFCEKWSLQGSVISDLMKKDPSERPSATELLQSSLFDSKDEIIEAQRLQIIALKKRIAELEQNCLLK